MQFKKIIERDKQVKNKSFLKVKKSGVPKLCAVETKEGRREALLFSIFWKLNLGICGYKWNNLNHVHCILRSR